MEASEVVIRPLGHDDVPAAQSVTLRALADLNLRTNATMYLEIPQPTPEQLGTAQIRFSHFIESDPGGCWVADAGGDIVGVAMALIREGLWGLSLLMVDPLWQSHRVGSRLLGAALEYGRECTTGLILSSPDARALRVYAGAGFRLQPHMSAYGTLDRTGIPALTGVRDGTIEDIELCASVDRHVRGAARDVDIPVLLGLGNHLLVSEDGRGRGYAVAKEGSVRLLAATTEDAARRLLWTALAVAPPGARVILENMTGAQHWAFDIVLAARLNFSHVVGGLLVRGDPGPLAPYLPSGAFL